MFFLKVDEEEEINKKKAETPESPAEFLHARLFVLLFYFHACLFFFSARPLLFTDFPSFFSVLLFDLFWFLAFKSFF